MLQFAASQQSVVRQKAGQFGVPQWRRPLGPARRPLTRRAAAAVPLTEGCAGLSATRPLEPRQKSRVILLLTLAPCVVLRQANATPPLSRPYSPATPNAGGH